MFLVWKDCITHDSAENLHQSENRNSKSWQNNLIFVYMYILQ